MRATVVLLVVLFVMASAQPGRPQANPVKLCGREFVRAVVYTCGGSRWRRFFREPGVTDFLADERSSLEQSSLEQSSYAVSSPEFQDWVKRDPNNFLIQMCCQVGCNRRDLTKVC